MHDDPLTDFVLLLFYVAGLLAFLSAGCFVQLLWNGLRTLFSPRRRRRPFPRTLVNVDLKDL
jgi:hypothetical protein